MSKSSRGLTRHHSNAVRSSQGPQSSTIKQAGLSELPGFIYDEATNRYVKIMPNHNARVMTGRAAEASHENAEEIKNSKKRCRSDSYATSRKPVAVSKPRIREHPVFGLLSIEERVRNRVDAIDCQTKAWASLLELQHCFPPTLPAHTWQAAQRTIDNSLMAAIKYDKTSTIQTAYSLQFNHTDHSGLWKYTYLKTNPFFSKITSLDVTESECFIATYSRDSPNYIIETPRDIHEPSTDDSTFCKSVPVRKTHANHDWWCTAYHPDHSIPKIAVGTENGVIVQSPYCPHGCGLQEWFDSVGQEHGTQPTTAIQWLSHKVAIAGRRDGLVRLYDTRAKGSVFRLRHGKAVFRLKCADESRILIGGPLTLCMYDLRYNKPMHKARDSRPWLKYKSYDNRRIVGADLDISPNLGLLAVAQQTSTELWNLWTGEKISELFENKPHPGLGRDPAGPHEIKSTIVHFTRENHKAHFFVEESDPVGLLTGNDDLIQEWALEDRKDVEPHELNKGYNPSD